MLAAHLGRRDEPKQLAFVLSAGRHDVCRLRLAAGDRAGLVEHDGVQLVRGLEEHADRLADEGKTPMYVALDGRAAGLVAVADTFKADFTAAIRAPHRMGLHVAMITGDNKRTAHAVARQVGIEGVLADVLPDQKAAEVRALQTRARSS